MAPKQSPLLHKNTDGKILYAIAYIAKGKPGFRYIAADGPGDALKQVLSSRDSLGKIMGIAPAIGHFEKAKERQRVYCYG